MEVNLLEFDLEIVKRISKDRMIKYKIVPYKEIGGNIYVLVDKKTDEMIEELQFILGKKLIFESISAERINTIINLVAYNDEENQEDIILTNGINENASDVHFEPRERAVIVRIRVDGMLKIVNLLSFDQYNKIISKVKIKSNLDITERRRPQDGKMILNYKDINYDLRVSIINTFFGEKVVIRILYGQTFDYSLDSLNLSKHQLDKINKIIKAGNGLTLLTGPTGSGKSTTLYTILQAINKNEINITTLEDPIEVIIPGVNQITLNRKVELDFATGLRSILRQDPDVLMIGEIRDDETASMAVRAAITGHKVYSTIHTKDPREVFLRLEEMGVKEYLIKDSLVGIISQRLVRTLCEKCKVFRETYKLFNKEFDLYKKVGCAKCGFTGYKGRKLVAAVYHIDKELKKSLLEIYNDSDLLNNNEMEFNLRCLLFDGQITIEEYYSFLEVEEIKIDGI